MLLDISPAAASVFRRAGSEESGQHEYQYQFHVSSFKKTPHRHTGRLINIYGIKKRVSRLAARCLVIILNGVVLLLFHVLTFNYHPVVEV
jgi:hypothetical protein